MYVSVSVTKAGRALNRLPQLGSFPDHSNLILIRFSKDLIEQDHWQIGQYEAYKLDSFLSRRNGVIIDFFKDDRIGLPFKNEHECSEINLLVFSRGVVNKSRAIFDN